MQARAAHAIRRSAYPQAAAGRAERADPGGKISGFCVTSRTAAVIHAFPAGRPAADRVTRSVPKDLTAQDSYGTALVTDARGMRQRPAGFQLIRLYV